MRRIFALLLLITLFTLTLPEASSALSLLNKTKVEDRAPTVAGNAGFSTETNRNTLTELTATIINAFLSLLGVFFLGLLVYAGFRWMNAQGNEEEVTKAKNIITQAVIGLAIILAAYVISYFVVSALQEKTLRANVVEEDADFVGPPRAP